MKAVLQLVDGASVSIKGEVVSEIGKGFLIFVGFEKGDEEAILAKMAHKIARLRLFPDAQGKTNLSLSEVSGEILSISQFTLLASVKEGNRPSFVNSLKGEESKPLYERFNALLRLEGAKVKEGVFGADMDVRLLNKGPFTLILDSKELFR
ncbi:MAG: D-tyrosyl-tRNA(Tyr) deacylase [Firmicutes bacterium]|uniref:D-aminoacyl-tRNA deacylase n=1 Tax=Candidatus Alloenteromonas pullistercoris TaxID=2840785 RepID=A0A9D9DFQ6_9FIRM|nr:D-tyrosyl-tRNA(Tyr) deacylase [Candidatus Enteromonas pullistercoris]